MTKNRDNKQAIRAYMRAHGVNYTTAKRALRERRTITAAQLAESSRIEQAADATTVLGPLSYADATTGAIVPLIKNTNFASPVDDVHTCPDCGHGTSDGRLACDPDCLQGRHIDLTAGPGLTPDEWHLDRDLDRDEDGYAITVRRAPVFLDPRLQRDTLDRFPHVHDLDGNCITNRHRELCDRPRGTTVPRPTTAAIISAYSSDATAHVTVLPVFMDLTNATAADQMRAPHIHDLTGRCIKNRTGNFCPTPRPPVDLLRDHNTTPLKTSGAPTQVSLHRHGKTLPSFDADTAGPMSTINQHQPKIRSDARIHDTLNVDHNHDNMGRGFPRDRSEAASSDHPAMVPTFRVSQRPEILKDITTDRLGHIIEGLTPAPVLSFLGLDPNRNYLNAAINRLADTNTDAEAEEAGEAANMTASDDPLPDGTTIRRWYATTIEPDTGERIPTMFTQTRYPADQQGHRREVVTQTPVTGPLATDEAWAALADAPTRRDELVAALKADTQQTKTNTNRVKDDALNAHRRAHAPGPAPADIQSALEQLADNELALRELTSDPETPVTYEMLRHAILATTTHGETWGGGKWHPTAADVCRSYLLGVEVTTSHDTPEVDGQHYVHPQDLAGMIAELADDEMALDEAVEGTAVTADDIAEELLILANRLGEPHDPKADVSPATSDDHHYLVVTTGQRRSDRRYKVDCTTPASQASLCEGWEECPDCTHLTLNDDAYDELLDTGIAHGIEHTNLGFGPAIRTGQCALIAFPEAWEESDAILNLPPGRYAINSKWEDEYCTIWLRTHPTPTH